MKSLQMKQLTEKDEEIAEALISLKLSRPIARTLSYLRNKNEATSVELERSTGLRQPEISIVSKELKERGWIDEREEKTQGKGRPYKIYMLKIGFDEIVAQLEKQQEKVVEVGQKKIERLKELGKKD